MSAKRFIIKSSYIIGTITGANPALVSGDMSADIVGPTTNIDTGDQVCYQVSWTSSNAVGTISVQGSVDGKNFQDLTFNPALTQPASNNGTYLINLALVPFPFIRLKYTHSSGSGSLVVYMSAKGN